MQMPVENRVEDRIWSEIRCRSYHKDYLRIIYGSILSFLSTVICEYVSVTDEILHMKYFENSHPYVQETLIRKDLGLGSPPCAKSVFFCHEVNGTISCHNNALSALCILRVRQNIMVHS